MLENQRLKKHPPPSGYLREVFLGLPLEPPPPPPQKKQTETSKNDTAIPYLRLFQDALVETAERRIWGCVNWRNATPLFVCFSKAKHHFEWSPETSHSHAARIRCYKAKRPELTFWLPRLGPIFSRGPKR